MERMLQGDEPNRGTDVAVVGLGCWYPGARDPRQLWENVLARRREFRRMPDERLPLSEYHDADPSVPDKTYGRRAAVIDGFAFDWASMRIPKGTFEGTDIAQWLALEVARQALEDAGLRPEAMPRDRTGVILGNSLTGEQTRSTAMRTRWPFVRKALMATASAKGFPAPMARDLADAMEEVYKSAFAPVTEDTLAGGLSNTIAGRICNFFDFHGGGYTVDGACSSSMLAVVTASNLLANRDLDVVLAGGVDVSLDTFELIGFAKAGALAKEDMRVYDRRASGFIPGEGCGFVVLKRLEDARAAGDSVYAVIKGWGVSSDGKGGITAPSRDGQATALQRAYDRAGYSPLTLDFIEGHGTGTPLGDKIELSAIASVMQANGAPADRICGVTSLKSIIGHTKAAAGIGAFIKAVIASNRRVLPPTAGCAQPHALFEAGARSLFPILLGEVMDPGRQLRAGVSAMGFGGINTHVTLESGDAPHPKLAPSLDERALLVSPQEEEIFVFGASSAAELVQQVSELSRITEHLSLSDLTDLAAQLARQVPANSAIRAAVIAHSPESLTERLRGLETQLTATPLRDGEVFVSPQKDLWIGQRVHKTKMGFLMPGQGSQQISMARVIVERHPWARDLVQQADAWVTEAGGTPVSPLMFRRMDRVSGPEELQAWKSELAQTEVAQPAICLASLIYARYLEKLGIRPSWVGGHSLGELVAFHLAGAFDEASLLKLATLRGRLMAAPAGSAGSMASLSCNRNDAEALIAEVAGYVTIANLNSPSQTVVSGETSAIEEVLRLAAARDLMARRLPVSNAFHSNLVAGASEQLKSRMEVPAVLGPLSAGLVSGMGGVCLEPGLDLRDHFSRQILSEVDFLALGRRLHQACDLLVEVGPGRVLSGLMQGIVEASDAVCSPVASSPGSDRDLHIVLARAFVHGVDVRWPVLFEGRLHRPFIPSSKRIYIDNPCERPLSAPQALPGPTEAWGDTGASLAAAVGASQAEIQAYLSQRHGFLADVVRADMRSLPALSAQPLLPPKQPPSIDPPGANELVSRVPQASLGLEQTLIDLVAARTGYPAESISTQSRLLDDLNLDSIKAAELVAAAAKAAGAAGKVDPSTLANATLEQIALEIQKVGISSEPPATAPSGLNLEQTLIDLVAARTGYPAETISKQSRLLDDLNLDSIKAAELVAAAAKAAGAAGKVDPSTLANATLEQIALEIQKVAGAVPSDPRAPLSRSEAALLEQACRLTGYARNSLDLNANVGADLNLDLLKVRQLVDATCQMLGLQARVDLEPLQSRTLRQIAQVFDRLAEESLPAEAASEAASWVRDFAVEMVPQPLPESDQRRRQEDDWTTAKVLVVAEEAEADLAEAFGRHFYHVGAQVEQASFAEVRQRDLVTLLDPSQIIVVLPRHAQGDPRERLLAMIERLTSVTRSRTSQLTPRRRNGIAFVQFAGGCFGADGTDLDVGASSSFARSLHLERPDLRVRVVDFVRTVDPERAAHLLAGELLGPEGFRAAGYDAASLRRVPQAKLLQPATYESRGLNWTGEDVVLVTGGGKGITAECAIALARATGVKLALVGRSPIPQPGAETGYDAELARTLERLHADRLTYRYYSCDLADPRAVGELVARVRDELGAITGVVHGAGMNQPRRIEQVSPEEALREIAPKLLGALYLSDALADAPPRLFVAFTSIIGVTGMPGNAWYAFSNEALDRVLRKFAAEHPETRVQSIAYSVWGETGMGARMGSAKNLGRMGIAAIPTDEGVRRFLQLFSGDPHAKQVVVTARLGGLDTWPSPELPAKAAHRFAEHVVRAEAGVELVTRTRLTLARDPFLQDHLYRGSYLFPTVFGLEAMGEVASWLTGREPSAVSRLETIRLERPIVVDPHEGVEIELQAIALEFGGNGEQHVQVSIRTEQTGFAIDHFSAVLVFGDDTPKQSHKLDPSGEALGIDPLRDLYGDLLFQGPLFQRMENVLTLTSQEVVFTTRSDAAAAEGKVGIARKQEVPLALGDPYLRDVMLQSVQLTIPQDICLPVFIERIERFPCFSHGPRVVHTVLLRKEGRDYVSEVVLTDQAGNVLERLSGYRLRILEERPGAPTAEELADPQRRDERLLQEAIGPLFAQRGMIPPAMAIAPMPHLHQLGKEDRHVAELPLIARALSGLPGVSDHQVSWSREGRPQLTASGDSPVDLSLTHDDHYCLCVAGNGKQGVDLEPLSARSREDWIALLGHQQATLLEALMASGDSLDVAATRLWTAGEAVRKAGISRWDLAVLERHGKAVILRVLHAEGECRVVTLPLTFTRPPERMLALMMGESHPGDQAEPLVSLPEAPVHRSWMSEDGPQGQSVYHQVFQVTFKECGSLSRNVLYSNYFNWTGKLREGGLIYDAPELPSQLASGEWGLVTNWSETRVFGEATTNDWIQASLMLTEVSNPTTRIVCEFRKLRPDGRMERLAISEQETTWVHITGHGEFVKEDFPPYLDACIARLAPKHHAPRITERLPEPLATLSMGEVSQQAPRGPNIEALLFTDTIQTTLEEANGVGNLYFSNYPSWQARARDLFLHALDPSYLRGIGQKGEMLCLRSRIDHLRDGMPFDRIEIRVAVGSVFECGATFKFQFYRLLPNGMKEKLAVGEQDIVWVTRSADGTPEATSLPADIREALLQPLTSLSRR